MEKPYNIVLYPSPNYFRHFLVFAESPTAAIHKLNYQARQALPYIKEQYPDDIYGKVSRVLHIIKTTRRYKRWYKHRFTSTHQAFAVINEIPTSIVYEGQLNFGTHTGSLIQNLLPDLLNPKIRNG